VRSFLVGLLLVIAGLIPAQPVQAQDPMCCPVGYTSSWWQCPFGTDLNNNCCKRLGFGSYDIKPKISCTDPGVFGEPILNVCKFADNNAACTACAAQGHAWTAIGCIPTDPSGLLETLLRFGIGLAGGIAFLLIILGGFQMMTSAGNPEGLNAGRELVGSAVTGLILIIFSVFLLRVIGYDILGIPGFG
jgi:hypothetical protein